MANYEYAKAAYAKYGVDTDKAIEILSSHGKKASVIGRIVEGEGVTMK